MMGIAYASSHNPCRSRPGGLFADKCGKDLTSGSWLDVFLMHETKWGIHNSWDRARSIICDLVTFAYISLNPPRGSVLGTSGYCERCDTVDMAFKKEPKRLGTFAFVMSHFGATDGSAA